jgi:hypothetical protein
MYKYCKGIDQRIARHLLRKHGPKRNNRMTGLCNPFLGNGSVNILPRRCNDITTIMGSCHVFSIGSQHANGLAGKPLRDIYFL